MDNGWKWWKKVYFFEEAQNTVYSGCYLYHFYLSMARNHSIFFFRANHYKNLFNKIYSLIQKKFLGVNGSCQCNNTMHTYNNFTNTFTPKGKSHCMKSVQIRSYFWSGFSCILTEYGKMLSLRIQSEYRKIRTRNNYVFGHFSCSE